MNVYAKQKKIHRHRKRLVVTKGEMEEGRDKFGVRD